MDAGTIAREARAATGLPLQHFAAMAGVSASTQARIESGDANPRMSTLTKICRAGGLDLVVVNNHPLPTPTEAAGISHA